MICCFLGFEQLLAKGLVTASAQDVSWALVRGPDGDAAVFSCLPVLLSRFSFPGCWT